METVACGLCGAHHAREVVRQRDLTDRMSDQEFTVVRCEECGLLYTNPRPSPDEIGRFYPSAYFGPPPVPRKVNRVKRWVMEAYYGYPPTTSSGLPVGIRKWLLWPDWMLRLLRGKDILPWVGQGRLLDVGCGTGTNVAMFQEQGWTVHGVDTSDVAVARARERFGDRVRLGHLDQAGYRDREFDVVLFSHSLEHMFDPPAVLKEVWRILDTDGHVVITVPNAGSLEARLFGRWWFPWELPRHLYHFEKTTLCRLLEHAGFRITRVRTGVGSLFFMASLERFWMHRLGRALPFRRLVEKLIARPFCLIAGHLGYGTEITVYAVKRESGGKRDSGVAGRGTAVTLG
ncbi:MAG: hypothetical protein KatS3mg082_1519 [Nitrospiraceae bacterium]|nr:MAG: hypothetical protein KatS3mg082_1519 [Nitrospiraceae bacterium]